MWQMMRMREANEAQVLIKRGPVTAHVKGQLALHPP